MRAWVILVGLMPLGCVKESVLPTDPLRTPVNAPGYAWPPHVTFVDSYGPSQGAAEATSAGMMMSERGPEPRLWSAPGAQVPVISSEQAPGAEACLRRLTEQGVIFEQPKERRGVTTPVVVKSDLGGIEYVAGAGLPLELDCRMALTLTEAAPIARALGVTHFRFSGAYVYRMSRVGRLSLHAHGLAIDIHAAKAGGSWHEVKGGYKPGLADGCAEDAPVLNRVACEFKKTGRFRELLTPDYDADHHDHLHLGIARDDGAATASDESVAQLPTDL